MSLKFKGDKPKKSKKRSHREIDETDQGEGSSTGTVATSVKSRYGKNPEGWVLALSQEDLVGPLFITSKSSLSQSDEPLALATNPINYKTYPFPMPAGMTAETGEPTTIDTIWRCARVPESDDKLTFKSSQDRYLACDQVGEVSAEREARGAQEEFVLIPVEGQGKGAYAIRSAAWGKYMSVDEVAGGKLELRCDADEVGDDETFFVKMQSEFLGKMEEERRRKMRKNQPDDGLVVVGDMKAMEDINIRKYQARGAGRLVSSTEDLSNLRRAKEEGRMAEELLNRRMKLKSDRYC